MPRPARAFRNSLPPHSPGCPPAPRGLLLSHVLRHVRTNRRGAAPLGSPLREGRTRRTCAARLPPPAAEPSGPAPPPPLAAAARGGRGRCRHGERDVTAATRGHPANQRAPGGPSPATQSGTSLRGASPAEKRALLPISGRQGPSALASRSARGGSRARARGFPLPLARARGRRERKREERRGEGRGQERRGEGRRRRRRHLHHHHRGRLPAPPSCSAFHRQRQTEAAPASPPPSPPRRRESGSARARQ